MVRTSDMGESTHFRSIMHRVWTLYTGNWRVGSQSYIRVQLPPTFLGPLPRNPCWSRPDNDGGGAFLQARVAVLHRRWCELGEPSFRIPHQETVTRLPLEILHQPTAYLGIQAAEPTVRGLLNPKRPPGVFFVATEGAKAHPHNTSGIGLREAEGAEKGRTHPLIPLLRPWIRP
jgi:hypothetical protein